MKAIHDLFETDRTGPRNGVHRFTGLTEGQSTFVSSQIADRNGSDHRSGLLAKEGFECLPECKELPLHSLQLPPEFEDLTGVIQNDLKVIVSILTEPRHRSSAAHPAPGSATPADALEQLDRNDQQDP